MSLKTVLITKEEQKAGLRLLKKARTKIKNKTQDYVCVALTASRRVAGEGGWVNYLDTDVATKLRQEIRVRMNFRTFVDQWLEHVKGIPYQQLTSKNMREYRLRWIDSMIKELE